ncbi:MAG: hypothetical protein ACXV0U_09770 [Kineosporiaceae bacterium]
MGGAESDSDDESVDEESVDVDELSERLEVAAAGLCPPAVADPHADGTASATAPRQTTEILGI